MPAIISQYPLGNIVHRRNFVRNPGGYDRISISNSAKVNVWTSEHAPRFTHIEPSTPGEAYFVFATDPLAPFTRYRASFTFQELNKTPGGLAASVLGSEVWVGGTRTPGGAWHFEWTFDTGAAGAQNVLFDFVGPGTDAILSLAEYSLLEATTADVLEPSFDGGAGMAGRGHAWTGTPFESASIETVPARVTPLLMLGYQVNKASSNHVHTIMGSAAPIVVRGPVQTRRGELRFLLEDAAHKDALVATFAGATAFDLAYVEQPSVAMRFELGEGDIRIELDPETRKLWTVDVPFVEVTL